MDPIETYVAAFPITEATEPSDGKMRLTVRVIPFGQTITHDGRKIRYQPGSITPPPHGTLIPFTVDHGSGALERIGKVERTYATADALYAHIAISDTTAGRDLYRLASDGVITDVSGGIRVTGSQMASDGVWERSGTLDHVSAVPTGAFGRTEAGSKILAVHNQEGQDMDPENTTAEIADVRASVETLAADIAKIDAYDDTELRDEIRSLNARFDTAPANTTPPAVDPVDIFTAELRSIVLGDTDAVEQVIEKYALADVTGTTGGTGDASGLMPQDWWAGGLVDVRGGWRPLFSRLGSMKYPASGSSIGYPVVKSGPKVGKRSAQKSDVNTEKLVVEPGTAPLQWFDSGLDIAFELIDQSDPAVLGIVWGRMLAKLRSAIEAYSAAEALAHGTGTGAVFDTTDYGKIVQQLITGSETIRQATDYPGDRVAFPTADWIKLVGMVDTTGRRVFATIGSDNADGSAPLTAQALDIGGIMAFHAPDLTSAVQFNTEAIKGAEKGPRRLQAVNVGKAGLDIGLLGSTVVAATIPAGVLVYKAP